MTRNQQHAVESRRKSDHRADPEDAIRVDVSDEERADGHPRDHPALESEDDDRRTLRLLLRRSHGEDVCLNADEQRTLADASQSPHRRDRDDADRHCQPDHAGSRNQKTAPDQEFRPIPLGEISRGDETERKEEVIDRERQRGETERHARGRRHALHELRQERVRQVLEEDSEEEDRLDDVERRLLTDCRGRPLVNSRARQSQPLHRSSDLQEEASEKGRSNEEGCEVLHAALDLVINKIDGHGDGELHLARRVGLRQADHILVGAGIGRPGFPYLIGLRIDLYGAVDDESCLTHLGVEVLEVVEYFVEPVEVPNSQVEFDVVVQALG